MHTSQLKIGFAKVLMAIILMLSGPVVSAQCAMCRAVLEGSDNQKQGEAVNDGIVYLMAVPYVLVGIVGYFIYRSRRKLREG